MWLRDAPVEVSSTEATPIMLPSRKGRIGLTSYSADDLATTPAASEVGERSDLGMLASLLFSQERERDKCDFIWNLSLQ